jgi:hypothetical protein
MRLCWGFGGLSGDGCIALPVAKEERGLVDEDSDQPAFEGSFAAEPWQIARGGEATVFDCLLGFIDAVEDSACDEIKQLSIARELEFEGALQIFARFAVGFEAAASDGKVDSLDSSRSDGTFWGGVCHKRYHFSVLQLV